MKKIFSPLLRVVMAFLTVAILMLQAASSTKIISPDHWVWQNPLPLGNDLNGVWGSSSTDVFAVGASGTILHFNGSAWSAMSSGTTNNLCAVWGSTSKDGTSGLSNDVYTVGAAGTILHYDGNTWSGTSSGTNDLYGVWGSSPLDVYAVGAAGTIIHYDGSAWSDVSSGTNDLHGVWGTTSSNVYAVGVASTMLHYDGVAWSAVTYGGWGVDLNCVWGSSSSDVYAGDNGGWLWHYNGTEWSQALTPGFAVYGGWGSLLSNVFVAGYYCSDFGCYFIAQESATSPFVTNYNGPKIISGLWGSSSTDVFAVGGSGTILHNDGTGWSSISSGFTDDLNAVWGSSSTNVYAVQETMGGYDFVYIPHYDGSTWEVLTPQNPVELTGIWGSSSTDMFAVGPGVYGGILHFDGISWSFMDGKGSGVWGSSSSDVYTVGPACSILHYDGNSWSDMSYDGASDLYGVWGSSSKDKTSGLANDIFAVGANGLVLHYDGSAWASAGFDVAYDLYAVWGSSSTDTGTGLANDVYVVGSGGMILHYDGTGTYGWSFTQVGTNDLYAVWGTSSSDVFAVGAAGTILHYDGVGWSSMNSGTTWGLRGVWGSSSTDIFAVGMNGTILHYEPPTAPDNPPPTTTSISPTTTMFGSPTFTLTVNGKGFISGSSVRLNGHGITTKYISSTQLTAQVLFTDLTSVGTFNITVFNPSPGGGESNSQSLTVSQGPTALFVAPATGACGGVTTLSATLTSSGVGVNNEYISFSLNGTVVGTATTGDSGVAALTITLPVGVSLGIHPGYIGASFAGDSNYTASTGTGALTIGQGSTSLSVVYNTVGTYGGTVDLSATLLTSGGVALSGESVAFSLNGAPKGTVLTDINGIATIKGISLSGLNVGTYPGYVGASFAGEVKFSGSAASGNLGVTQAPTSITVADARAPYTQEAQSVNLSAAVTSPAGTVNSGFVYFDIRSNSDTSMGHTDNVPVRNGNATASCTLRSDIPLGSFIIHAYYHSNDNFAPSNGQGELAVYLLQSDLRFVSFEIPPDRQGVDPQLITVEARVHNYGPNPAYHVIVIITYKEAGYAGTLNLRTQDLGYIPNGGELPVQADWTLQSPVTFTATVNSASILPNPPNNVATLELDGLYYTDNTPGPTNRSDHTFIADRDGYNFANSGSSVDFDLFTYIFGSDNVYDSYNVLVGTISFVDPLAWLFYNYVWGPWFGPGVCYGMATTSLNFWEGVQNVKTFSPLATSVYTMQMMFPREFFDLTWRNILRYHGTELGYQVLNQEVLTYNIDPKSALSKLEAQMKSTSNPATSDPNILVMLDFISMAGHAVVPYRIVHTPDYADIYFNDNNFPRSGSALRVNLQSNTWYYHSSQFSGSGSSGLFWVPRSLNDPQPILPYKRLTNLVLDFVYSIIVGGSNANMQNTDSSGRALGYQNGTFVQQIPGAMRILPHAGSSAGSSFPEAYVLPAAGQYVTTLSGTGIGPAGAGFLRDAAALTFTSQSMTPSTRDTINFSQDGNTVTLGTNVANEQYSTTLYQKLTNSTRKYTVGNTAIASGETITQAIINGGASFEVINQGKPKTYDLTLEQVGLGSATTSLTGLAIGSGETHIFTVSDWTNLPATEVDLQVKNSQGTTISTKALKITFVDAQRKTHLTVNTLDKLFQFTAPSFDSGLINAPKMRVINIDPANPSAAMTYNKQTKTWQPDPSKLGAPALAAAWVSQCQFKTVPKEFIVIPYEDANILFFAVAAHSTTDKCVAFLYQKSTKKIYILIR